MDSVNKNVATVLNNFFQTNGGSKDFKIDIINNPDNPKAPIYLPDLNRIELNLSDLKFYDQFTFQLAHELTHAYTGEGYKPDKIRWFEELLASNMSFFALDYLSVADSHRSNYFQTYKLKSLTKIKELTEEDALRYLKNNLKHHEEHPREIYLDLAYPQRFLYDLQPKVNIWNLIKIYTQTIKHQLFTKSTGFSSSVANYAQYDIFIFLDDAKKLQLNKSEATDVQFLESVFS